MLDQASELPERLRHYVYIVTSQDFNLFISRQEQSTMLLRFKNENLPVRDVEPAQWDWLILTYYNFYFIKQI